MVSVTTKDIKAMLAGLSWRSVVRIDDTCVHVSTANETQTGMCAEVLRHRLPAHDVLVYDDETLGILG